MLALLMMTIEYLRVFLMEGTEITFYLIYLLNLILKQILLIIYF